MHRARYGMIFVGAVAHVWITLMLIAGCTSSQVSQANSKAVSSTQTSLTPLLQEVAANHPEQKAAVDAVIASWPTSPERSTYSMVKPLLLIEKADRPDLANAIDAKLSSWDRRLTANGQ